MEVSRTSRNRRSGVRMGVSSGSARGFTLVEMMVIVVIVAILAALAYPSYSAQVRKARRTDAMEALLYLQQLQERYRISHAEYGTLVQVGYPGATGTDVLSEQGHYTLSVSNTTAIGYRLTATATGGQAADTECASLAIEVSASHPRGERQSSGGGVCWRY